MHPGPSLDPVLLPVFRSIYPLHPRPMHTTVQYCIPAELRTYRSNTLYKLWIQRLGQQIALAWCVLQVKWSPNSVMFIRNGFWGSQERPYGGCVYVWLYSMICMCLHIPQYLFPTRPPQESYSDIIWDNEEKETWALDSLTPLLMSV